LNRRRGGRHRGKTGGLLRPHARWLSAAVPVSSQAEDHPGLGGILERLGGPALSQMGNRHRALFQTASRPSMLRWRKSCTGDQTKGALGASGQAGGTTRHLGCVPGVVADLSAIWTPCGRQHTETGMRHGAAKLWQQEQRVCGDLSKKQKHRASLRRPVAAVAALSVCWLPPGSRGLAGKTAARTAKLEASLPLDRATPNHRLWRARCRGPLFLDNSQNRLMSPLL
jgi:hypothetical protein